MSWLSEISVGSRILVFLRQISRELKRSNDLSEARMWLDDPKWKAKVDEKPTKMAEIVRPSVKDWNEEYWKKYREEHPGEEA